MNEENLPEVLNENEMFNVLSNSLYPGAARESIQLVINYCKASKLDPMLKPVHIVPMYCATGEKNEKGYDIKAMRDVIMPGIGLYRIQAARSNEYAGVSDAKYGDDVFENLGGLDITYPKWCKVTVKRLLSNGAIAEFSATEFWKENYATKNKDTSSPNAMWARRPYAQLAKCAEAQALRKAFPEIGAAPTADEMEGKEIDITPVPEDEETKIMQCSDEKFMENKSKWEKIVKSGKKNADGLIASLATKTELTDPQKQEIKSWEGAA